MIKAVANIRVPGRRTPKQLHLGYIPDVSVSVGDRRKLQSNLDDHWMSLFAGESIAEIDWDDATEKLRNFWQQSQSKREKCREALLKAQVSFQCPDSVEKAISLLSDPMRKDAEVVEHLVAVVVELAATIDGMLAKE